MPNVSATSAAVNSSVPGQSMPCAAGSRDSPIRRVPSSRIKTAISAMAKYSARQPRRSIRNPDAIGPNARPTPNAVPRKLNARVRCAPSNSCASSEVAEVSTKAPPRPSTARSRLSSSRLGLRPISRDVTMNVQSPATKQRLRPIWSPIAPAAMTQPPKAMA